MSWNARLNLIVLWHQGECVNSMRQMQFPDLYDTSVHLCYPGLCPFYLCSRALFILVYLYYMRLFVFTYHGIEI